MAGPDRSWRTRDRLLGAAMAVGVVLLLVVVAVVGLAWWVSEPAEDSPGPAAPPSVGGSGAGGAPEAPADLGADETWLGDLVLDTDVLVTADATLRDVAAVGSGARTGPDGTTVARLEVEATVPFEVVARELGEGSTVRAADDGQAAVTREVVSGGRTFSVVATGTVEVVDGLVVVEPRTVDIGGPAFLAEVVGALARELVTIEQPVEGLPDGLVLRRVEVRDDGFRVYSDGQDVVLGP